MMMIDIEDLKKVKENYGNIKGEEVIKEVEKRMMRIVCEEDKVERMGGDELMIVMNGGK